MKIWLLTSSPDILYLFRFLQNYNFSYHVWYDQEWWHRWEKSVEFVQKRIEQWLDALIEQWVEKCILPPSWELMFLADEMYKKYHDYILPVFSTYLMEYVLPSSRIGKIGFMGDRSDLQQQDIFKKFCHTYSLRNHQQTTKKFHTPFAFWWKEISMRKHFLTWLGRKNWMMHNVIKHDVRYFLDAWVDTLIPLNYWYFAFDVTISKMLRAKKCRWHRLEVVQSIFDSFVKGDNTENSLWNYTVSITHTGDLHELTSSKKWMWLLQKGKEISVKIEKI